MDAKTPVPFKTMKQALAWVQSEIAKMEAERAAE
jgi:predicted DNA-binding transcriptional regulator AlpA